MGPHPELLGDVAHHSEDHFWKDTLGTSATITTIGQFLSGMFTVYRIIVKQHGSVGELSPVPFIMGVVGCTLWLIYGYLKGDPTIVNCNIVGTSLNSLYVFIFVKYTLHKSLILRQVVTATGFITLILLYVRSAMSSAGVVLETDGESSLIRNLGLICVLITILSCASPLVALKEVLRSRSTETLPFPLILSMFLVCSQWWAYGALAGDFYMQFTNFLGTCISLAQLCLFGYFARSSSVGSPQYAKLTRIS